MKCPKCKIVDLGKSAFDKPFSCSKCMGVWLKSSMKPTLSTFFEDSILTGTAETKDHDGKTGLCPSGHGILIRAQVDIDDPFYLERCSTCGGIWFDKGELQKIFENSLAENLTDFWSRSWQQKQRKEKERNEYLEINKAHLGKDIIESILELSEMLRKHPEKSRAVALLQQEIGL